MTTKTNTGHDAGKFESVLIAIDKHYYPKAMSKTVMLIGVAIVVAIGLADLILSWNAVDQTTGMMQTTFWGAEYILWGINVNNFLKFIVVVAAPMSLIGHFYIGVKSKTAWYAYTLGYWMWFLWAFLLGLFASMIMYVILWTLWTKQYIQWDVPSEDGGSVGTTIKTSSIIVVIGYILFALIIAFAFTMFQTSASTNQAIDQIAVIYIDWAVFWFVLFGYGLVALNNKQGYGIMYLANFLQLAKYLLLGYWGSIASVTIYLLIDIAAVSRWELMYKAQERDEEFIPYGESALESA